MATATPLPPNHHCMSVYANRKFIEKLNTIWSKSNSNQKKSRTRDTDASTPLAEQPRKEVSLSLQHCVPHTYFMN